MKRKIWRWLALGVAMLLVASGLFLAASFHHPTEKAAEVSQTAIDQKGYLAFEGGDKVPLLVYPGALVDSASYSIWAQQLAQAGHSVYLLKVPLDLAVLAPDQAEKVLAAFPEKDFVLVGHSLGGVMASRFIHDHPERIKGMIFLASYPDEKGKLPEDLPVLSLTASQDQVLNWESYDAAKRFLPKTTVYEEISGGNHAGFGSYGKQSGDGTATITNATQQQEIAKLMTQWLAQFSEK